MFLISELRASSFSSSLSKSFSSPISYRPPPIPSPPSKSSRMSSTSTSKSMSSSSTICVSLSPTDVVGSEEEAEEEPPPPPPPLFLGSPVFELALIADSAASDTLSCPLGVEPSELSLNLEPAEDSDSNVLSTSFPSVSERVTSEGNLPLVFCCSSFCLLYSVIFCSAITPPITTACSFK